VKVKQNWWWITELIDSSCLENEKDWPHLTGKWKLVFLQLSQMLDAEDFNLRFSGSELQPEIAHGGDRWNIDRIGRATRSGFGLSQSAEIVVASQTRGIDHATGWR